MRLLLTGAPGWFGSRFLDLWSEGRRHGLGDCALRCFVQPGADLSAAKRSGVEVVRGDLRDRAVLSQATADVDLVVHAAAVIHSRDVAAYDAVNHLATAALLGAAARAGVRRFVHLSSDAAVGSRSRGGGALDEATPCRPRGPYGVSKHRAELRVRERDDPSAMRTIILRPCLFYGVRQPGRITWVMRLIRAGHAVVPGDGEARQSMTLVDDLVEAALLALDRPAAAGRTLFVADERPYTATQLLQGMAGALGVPLRSHRLPTAVPRAARAVDLLLARLGLYQAELHMLGDAIRDSVCSTRQARDALGLRTANDLEGGLRAAVLWARARGDRRL